MKFEVGARVRVVNNEHVDHWCVGRVGTIAKFPETAATCGIIPHTIYAVKFEHVGIFYLLDSDLHCLKSELQEVNES
ncbi:hypothetical protein LCGC14_1395670 [marine sediment metagenome]|uniref:Uncharacterized protein n=1 Tax=marine sediment metagenome TaxID=412755 RepID=A0A0F9ME80_9ZZZZ